MGEPIQRPERRRDRLTEAVLIAKQAGIGDPLGLSVAEFDGFLEVIAKGDLVRSEQDPLDCRSFVDNWVRSR